MTRNTKIILAVVAGVLVLLCLCAGAVALAASFFITRSTINTGSVMEATVGVGTADEAVAQFALPEGWRTDYTLNVAGFRLLGYRPDTGAGHIMLAQIPETEQADIVLLERQVRKMALGGGYAWDQNEMKVVERKPVTIRGQATELVISEGVASSGLWRQAMATFAGDRGLVLVIYGVPKDSWDQATADAFFASIQ